MRTDPRRTHLDRLDRLAAALKDEIMKRAGAAGLTAKECDQCVSWIAATIRTLNDAYDRTHTDA